MSIFEKSCERKRFRQRVSIRMVISNLRIAVRSDEIGDAAFLTLL